MNKSKWKPSFFWSDRQHAARWEHGRHQSGGWNGLLAGTVCVSGCVSSVVDSLEISIGVCAFRFGGALTDTSLVNSTDVSPTIGRTKGLVGLELKSLCHVTDILKHP